MGVFSFLTGKKEPEGGSGFSRTETPAPVPDAAPAPTPPPPIPAPAEPAFHAPDAWKIDALTAPKPEVAGDQVTVGPIDAAATEGLKPEIIATIKTVFDPEIPVDIYELGLIYDVIVDADKKVLVKMTLTSPACPSAQQIPSEVRWKVKAVPGVADASVEIVWEPPWDKDKMSEAAKMQLGFF